MPEQQDHSKQLNSNEELLRRQRLRALSRSPHPYHRQRAELPHARLKPSATFPSPRSSLRSTHNTDDEGIGEGQSARGVELLSARSTESDSGTEADDEHFLKGLPAPRWKPHKGLRSGERIFSDSPSPLVSPAILDEVVGKGTDYLRMGAIYTKTPHEDDVRKVAERFRRKRRAELRRRFTETVILAAVGAIVCGRGEGFQMRRLSNQAVCLLSIITSLVILYPIRLLIRSTYGRSSKRWPAIVIPASFDPAPLLYPPALTMFVASLLATPKNTVFLPNIILSVSSLPSELVPSVGQLEGLSILHWLISCIPLFLVQKGQALILNPSRLTNNSIYDLDRETLALLYPLHHTLCLTLQYLATTSLLRAEVQLLSISLINILLLSTSPQAVILKSLLWGGGIGTLVTCTPVLRWVVALARVPRWRFRRAGSSKTGSDFPGSKYVQHYKIIQRLRNLAGLRKDVLDDSSDDEAMLPAKAPRRPSDLRVDLRKVDGVSTKHNTEPGSISAVEQRGGKNLPTINVISTEDFFTSKPRQRRYTLPSVDQQSVRSSKRTPSGRRKRSASSSVQSFFFLTEREAILRKWLYAGYVYACVLCIILIGIRNYVGERALNGSEPVGWALGYLFGNLPWFRMQVITTSLDKWICLPDRAPTADIATCQSGWIEHLRHATFGPANTRLILCAYWLAIIIMGLAVVFRLSAIYEVDTRRKVFHFMMVAMLLPATYVDPTFAALALSLVLAIFLFLDLFRACQLPPLSKPLAYFLAPYVDGRDLRGPVVISHIFLLIGCAIPLWLSLGALARGGAGCLKGWEVDTRDVSMVSGVICVGMGDAAASLIGRRYGRHKWFWSGGKSIEGSLAFATAVAMALVFAKAWLQIGGWPSDNHDNWVVTFQKVGVAAGLASLTEAVLTGGNDNVVVPVVLWLCVKGLDI